MTSFLYLFKCGTVCSCVGLGSPQTVPDPWIWVQLVWEESQKAERGTLDNETVREEGNEMCIMSQGLW